MKEEISRRMLKDGLDSMVMSYILTKIYNEFGEDKTKKSIENHVYSQIPKEMTTGEKLFMGPMIPDESDIQPLICEVMQEIKNNA